MDRSLRSNDKTLSVALLAAEGEARVLSLEVLRAGASRERRGCFLETFNIILLSEVIPEDQLGKSSVELAEGKGSECQEGHHEVLLNKALQFKLVLVDVELRERTLGISDGVDNGEVG